MVLFVRKRVGIYETIVILNPGIYMEYLLILQCRIALILNHRCVYAKTRVYVVDDARICRRRASLAEIFSGVGGFFPGNEIMQKRAFASDFLRSASRENLRSNTVVRGDFVR